MSVSIKNSVSGGGGGITSDEVTAIASDVLKGKTYVGNDTNDEIGTGTLELIGNAAVGDVLSGATFYNTNAKSKQTGTLALTGNATAENVIRGYSFYSNNAKTKIEGIATVYPCNIVGIDANSISGVIDLYGRGMGAVNVFREASGYVGGFSDVNNYTVENFSGITDIQRRNVNDLITITTFKHSPNARIRIKNNTSYKVYAIIAVMYPYDI